MIRALKMPSSGVLASKGVLNVAQRLRLRRFLRLQPCRNSILSARKTQGSLLQET
jgi:hypothetical protein